VTVTIHNNGQQIPPEIQAQIFDPFFTTKPVGSGTGLGLATADQVIEQHQGEIYCHSSANQGTEFRITLPVNFPQSN
jgi:two-component system NtrC family sensor kinase